MSDYLKGVADLAEKLKRRFQKEPSWETADINVTISRIALLLLGKRAKQLEFDSEKGKDEV